MRTQLAVLALVASFHTGAGWSQSVPIYSVTVVERTVKAINYQYRGGQTPIDFAGTVLLPDAKGTALVESKSGRTEIDAKFSHVAAPTRFGREYLTYVLWAITPEGHAKNLGEVVADGSDHAHLLVTTDLQAFGLIVTAEPYSAVRQPSDVVVMENVVRPDTNGKTEPIQAKFELLPRGHYTYNKPPAGVADMEGPKVSMDRYESLLEIYQAQNAVQIARSQGADKYAADTLAKAEGLLAEARQMEERRLGRSAVVTAARQAAQTAEDARTIAVKHAQDVELAEARSAAAQEKQRREAAEREAREAKIEASQQRADLAQERLQREQAEATTKAARRDPEVIVVPAEGQADRQVEARRSELRQQLMQRMNGYFPTTDTPRGLVITLPSYDFRGAMLDPAISARVANLAALIAAQPGLSIEVEGHGEQYSAARASSVRDAMLRGGLSSRSVTSAGMGTSRPVSSNAAANRRVEIVVFGDPIGNLAHWDKAYSLK